MIQMSIEISLLQRAKTTTIATVFLNNIHLVANRLSLMLIFYLLLDQCATEMAQRNDVEYTPMQYLTWTH